jgi:hypothetical protein
MGGVGVGAAGVSINSKSSEASDLVFAILENEAEDVQCCLCTPLWLLSKFQMLARCFCSCMELPVDLTSFAPNAWQFRGFFES